MYFQLNCIITVPHKFKELFMQMGPNPHHLPLQHLKDITNNFSEEQILGRGGFGVVYKVS